MTSDVQHYTSHINLHNKIKEDLGEVIKQKLFY